ncbi:MAG: hypothetical protein WBO93_07015, partial [Gammaproteobacteria bacterium]
NLTVGTTKKSIDTKSLTCFFRKAFHVGGGGFFGSHPILFHGRFSNINAEFTQLPNTPWRTPQPVLASDILRINALISSDTGGLPGLPCLHSLAQ